MKKILAIASAALLAFSLSTTAYAHCGSCGTGAKVKLKKTCAKKCAKAKKKKACMKKCKTAHKKGHKKTRPAKKRP